MLQFSSHRLFKPACFGISRHCMGSQTAPTQAGGSKQGDARLGCEGVHRVTTPAHKGCDLWTIPPLSQPLAPVRLINDNILNVSHL